ncbi:MAG: Rossmann-like domain-containing protein [Promethearchaeota archaeon]
MHLHRDLLTEIKLAIQEDLGDQVPPVDRVVLGLGYTIVLLRGGYTGMACTLLLEASSRGCTKAKSAGRYHERSPIELAGLTEFEDPLDRGIGMAAMNALSDYIFRSTSRYRKVYSNLTSFLHHGPGSRVLMVGYQESVARELVEAGFNAVVFDDASGPRGPFSPLPLEGISFASTTPKFAFFEVVLLTGRTLVKQTIDEVLDELNPEQEVLAVGPTASCVPTPLFRRGVKAVGGLEVVNITSTVRVIMEGGDAMDLKAHCRPFFLASPAFGGS